MSKSLLVQTLALRDGKVLLGRWKTGPFTGRLTGMIGQMTVTGGAALPKPEFAASRTCRDLLGDRVQVDPRVLSRRALLTFEERDVNGDAAQSLGNTYSEYQLLHTLGPQEDFEPCETGDFEPQGWFGQGEIPFDLMPEDDRVWYDRVLFGGELLRGRFVFDGTSLLSHALEVIAPEQGLCGLDQGVPGEVLLLHNPDCAKCRTLRNLLTDKNVLFRERRYLEDPLSLSELETLAARLDKSRHHTSDLCRSEEIVEGARTLSHGGGDHWLLKILSIRPELLQRPVLVKGQRALLGRPSPTDAFAVLE
uniref:Uncharacterized protein n=1 Tax=Noctiluca scintillans TaxID=2966 RepID=A0A7S0ZR49_NOCSC|mmetsp:Transcript_1503/g.4115  ORF Transcript_1503/g.4115 Transcript_1503/m.4115 type:complete len:307 (+) Transcript_1503:63-983(+)